MENGAPDEGYVLHSYGPERRLHHAVASLGTLRRHDRERPVVLFCTPPHRRALQRSGLARLFSRIETLPEEARSLPGFMHRLHRFAPFGRTLFAHTDMVWCRDPAPLWRQLSGYDFTVTGREHAGGSLGGSGGTAAALDVVLRRRRRMLRRFGLTHVPHVRPGLLYVRDTKLAQKVCERAAHYLSRAGEMPFRSRRGQDEPAGEVCEWNLAMAMSHLGLSVVPSRQGHRSPQLDFVEGYVDYDLDFRRVRCRYYSDERVHELRGSPIPEWLRDGLIAALSSLPGRDDYLEVTPFALHFNGARQKQPFIDFATRTWRRLSAEGAGGRG